MIAPVLAGQAISKVKFWDRVGYNPHPKQQLFHESRARFRIPVCGRRFGKTMMAAMDLAPELLLPNRRYWIVAPTYNLAEKEWRVIHDTFMVKLKFAQVNGVRALNNKEQGRMLLDLPWNTHLEVRSADKPENLVGDALHGVIMSEAAKHNRDTWERFIRPALADYHGWATFPTTPEGTNWLHEEWLKGKDPNEPEYESWQFPSWENPHVYPGGRKDPEILLIERNSIKAYFLQEYGADFTAFVGKIFEEFSLQTHVRPHTFNPHWPNYMCIDWGFTDPMAVIEVQVSPDNQVYVWREHYGSYMTLSQHIEILKMRENPAGYRLDGAFADSAQPSNVIEVSKKIVGCHADPDAKKSWMEGVNLVKSFLVPRDALATEGPGSLPSLWVDPSCRNVIREFSNYRVAPHKEDRNAREAAKAFDDHALDAIRYGLMHIFRLGATRRLVEAYTAPDTRTPAAGTLYVPSERIEVAALGHAAGAGGFFHTGMEF